MQKSTILFICVSFIVACQPNLSQPVPPQPTPQPFVSYDNHKQREEPFVLTPSPTSFHETHEAPQPFSPLSSTISPALYGFAPEDENRGTIQEFHPFGEQFGRTLSVAEVRLTTAGNSVVIRVPLPEGASDSITIYKHSSPSEDWVLFPESPTIDVNRRSISWRVSESGQYLAMGPEQKLQDGISLSTTGTIEGSSSFAPFPETDETTTHTIQRATLSSSLPIEETVLGDPNKIALVFVHGSGSERKKPHHRWERLVRGLLQDKAFLSQFDLWDFFYPSEKEISVNAIQLQKDIQSTLGGRPYMIIAHSMGGLIAEILAALEYDRKTCLGIITLGTPHHGSPLAVVKLMLASLSERAFPTLKYALYYTLTHRLFSSTRFLEGAHLLSEAFRDTSFYSYTEGHRSLGFDGSDPEIPTRVYSLQFSFPPGNGPFVFTLSPLDRAMTSCKLSPLMTKLGARDVQVDTSSGVCYFNAVEALDTIRHLKMKNPEPYAYRYAGYFRNRVAVRQGKKEFFDAAFADLGSFIARDDSFMEQQGLRYASLELGGMPVRTLAIPNANEANDGFVPLASALKLRSGQPIVRISDDSVTIIDDALEQRKDESTIAHRVFPEYSHLDIVRGKTSNDILFESIKSDARALRDAYLGGAPTRVIPQDIDSLKRRMDVIYYNREYREGSYDDGSSYTRTPFSSSLELTPDSAQPVQFQAMLTISTRVRFYDSRGRLVNSYIDDVIRRAAFLWVRGKWYWITGDE